MVYHRSESLPVSGSTETEIVETNGEPVDISALIKDKEAAYKIEEQVEEITTTTTAADDDDDGDESDEDGTGHKRNKGLDRLDPYGLDLSRDGCARVAFPEMGLDIMDIGHPLLCQSTNSQTDGLNGDENDDNLNKQSDEVKNLIESNAIKVIDSTCWEENWLFQKKRKAENDIVPLYCLLNLDDSINPVTMLIPNPSQPMSPCVGSKSIDELSDLAERNSVGSLEFSSDESDYSERTCDMSENDAGQSVSASNSALNIHHKLMPTNRMKASLSSSSLSSSTSSTARDKKLLQNCDVVSAHVSSPAKPLKVPDFVPISRRSGHKPVNQVKTNRNSNINNNRNNNNINNCLDIDNYPNDDPCFIIEPQSATVQSDILVQFCCRVKGSQPLSVSWYRNGQLIDENSNDSSDFRIFKHFTDFILEIPSTRVDLSGVYSCCAYNYYNQLWTDFSVQIYIKPSLVHPHSSRRSTPKINTNPPPIKQRLTKQASGPRILSEHLHEKSHKVNSDESSIQHQVSASARLTCTNGSYSDELHHEVNGIQDYNDCRNKRNSRTPSPARPGTFAEREHRKWEESQVAWPDNPYTMENVGKRKHLNHFLDSIDPDSASKMTEDQEEENLCALPYISPSKDLERFKRDYYVPNNNNHSNVTCKDETLNGFEEKVYSSRYFSTSESNASNSDDQGLSQQQQSQAINERHLQYKHAEAKVLENPEDIVSLVSVKELINRFSNSKRASYLINGHKPRSLSSNGDTSSSLHLSSSESGIKPRLITDKHNYDVPFKLTCWQDCDNEDNDNDNNGNNRENLKNNSDQLHYNNITDEDEMKIPKNESPAVSSCDSVRRSTSDISSLNQSSLSSPPSQSAPKSKPVKPVSRPNQVKLNPINVNSITGRCLHRDFSNKSSPRSLNRLGSLSMFDIDQVKVTGLGKSESSYPESPVTCSPTNEGYISDESNLSERAEGKPKREIGLKRVVRRMAPSILKRASFWEKRCEQELSS